MLTSLETSHQLLLRRAPIRKSVLRRVFDTVDLSFLYHIEAVADVSLSEDIVPTF
jgi:hypothetical protein